MLPIHHKYIVITYGNGQIQMYYKYWIDAEVIQPSRNIHNEQIFRPIVTRTWFFLINIARKIYRLSYHSEAHYHKIEFGGKYTHTKRRSYWEIIALYFFCLSSVVVFLPRNIFSYTFIFFLCSIVVCLDFLLSLMLFIFYSLHDSHYLLPFV